MNRYEKAAAAAVALMLVAAGAIFLYAPGDALQGPVQWIIYAGYLLVRRLAEPGRQAARLAAVVGIFGFIDVPIVHFSVTWWRTQHPGPIIVNDALPAQMLGTFLLTLACTLVLAGVMIATRYRIETLIDQRQNIAEPVQVVAPHRGEA